MSNYPSLITRTIVCPLCRATATLSYTDYRGSVDRGAACQLVYICPNLCNVAQDELAALIGTGT